MNVYEIKISFITTVEAENREEAEDIGWDWTPIHLQDPMNRRIHPDMVEVKLYKINIRSIDND